MDILTPSSAPIKLVKKVQFGVFSPEEIKLLSRAKIEHAELYERGIPKTGGLSDPRMGPVESKGKKHKCDTCGETVTGCEGHFGHIELSVPVYHYGFLKIVKKILEMVCWKCSRLRLLPVDPDDPKDSIAQKYRILTEIRSPKSRFKYAWEKSKNHNICSHPDCGHLTPAIRKEGTDLWFMPRKNERSKKVQIKAEDALQVLEKISDDDCRLIGLTPENARPEWMIITVLPVPPMCVRPSVTMDNTGRGEDDLTHKLTDIVNFNNLVNKYKNDPLSKSVEEYKKTLQWHVTTYIDNDVSGIDTAQQKAGRPIKALSARLKGKEGRLRGNLQGKRVNFAARTVITGDPNLSIEEVGVPLKIAMNLTFPETVTEYNLAEMQKLVQNGPSVYPGAKYVFQADRKIKDLRYWKQPFIAIGDKVERHLRDGDIVVFNRQPSLHKMSMMGHRVRVMQFSTFRMNLTPTTCFNADFDGDEMNIHIPQSYSCKAEIQELAMVKNMIVSPQANKPVMGIVQDALLGSKLFTHRDNFLTKEDVMNLVMWLPQWDGILPSPAIFKPIPLWTGKQIFSMMIPDHTFVTTYHSTHPDDESEKYLRDYPQNIKDNSLITYGDTRVLIQDGELLSGIICKKTIGTASCGLIHVIFNDHGADAARDFLDGCQYIMSQWLMKNGFSVGIGDNYINTNTGDKIIETIQKAYEKVDENIEKARRGQMLPQGTNTLEGTVENTIMNILNGARDGAGKLATTQLSEKNNIKQMVQSGSKGSTINISQISAVVGQQNVDGKRIFEGFDNRTLPHFTKFDRSPASKGFVQNSYIRGLEPHEMFFHAMGGREGLIDTAVKTAESGYIQRRLVKAMEDVTCIHDGTVRNSRGEIIQFHYGEDGMDGTCIEQQTLSTLLLSDKELDKGYNLYSPEFAQIVQDRDFLRSVYTNGEDRVSLPMNLKRMVVIAKSTKFPTSTQLTDRHAQWIYQKVTDLCSTLSTILKIWQEQDEPTRVFATIIRAVLCSKKVIRHHKLSKEQFEWILTTIKKRFGAAMVNPGEMVGTLASQSIGEPATQMTLNTFHLSGVGNVAVTQGIPRLKELINAAKHLKTPTMNIYFTDDVRFDKRQVQMRKIQQIEHTTFAYIIDEFTVHYDPDYRNSLIESDISWMQNWTSLPDDDNDDPHPELLSSYVLRIVLNRRRLAEKFLTMDDIYCAITRAYENDVFIMHSDDNSPELVVHLRLYEVDEVIPQYLQQQLQIQPDAPKVPPNEFYEYIMESLQDHVTICGIPGIDKASVSENRITQFNKNGSLETIVEYIVQTDGINMEDAVKVDDVDTSRIYCNDPQQMLDMFGAEAARLSLLKELRSVIEYDGSYVNYRHLALLCDVMTQRGAIMSVTRHGINRTDAGPLMKSSFEQTVDILIDAGLYGEVDNLKGVAENIIMGKIAPVGTGTFDMLLDMNMLDKAPRQTMNVEIIEREPDPKKISPPSANTGSFYSPLRPSYLNASHK